MKVVVTGGAGFIGSHAVERLLDEGYHVNVIDNLTTGRIENIEPFLKNPNCKFFENDINEMSKLDDAYQGADWILHFAALADIVPSIEQPVAYHRANVDGTLAVMEMARKHRVKRVVYAASSSCYGIPEVYPTPEETEASPRYPYALTKYLGEQIVMHWSQLYKIPAVSLRFFNVYGPRSRTSGTYGAVFGVFLAQRIHGKPYTIVGDGTQSRDFTYVTDVVDAVITAAKSDVTGEIMNVGSSGHYPINQIVELLGGGKIEYVPKRPGEPDITFADTKKIKEKLNWKAKVSIDEGIKKLIENISYWEKAPVWTPSTIKTATQKWFDYLS